MNSIIRIFLWIKSCIHRLSIYRQIFFSTILIIVVIYAISAVSTYMYIKYNYINDAVEGTIKLSENINNALEDYQSRLKKIIFLLYNDEKRKKVFNSKQYVNLADELESMRTMGQFFSDILMIMDEIDNIYIYLSESKSFSYSREQPAKIGYNPEKEEWYQRTLDGNGRIVVFPVHKPFQLEDGKDVFSMSVVIKDGDFQPIGVMLIDISSYILGKVMEGISDRNSEIFIIADSEVNFFYTNRPMYLKEEFTRRIQGMLGSWKSGIVTGTGKDRYIAVHNRLNISNWQLYTMVSYVAVERSWVKILLFLIGLLPFILLIAGVISLKFSRFIYMPVKKLRDGISVVKQENFDVHLETEAKNEIGELVDDFNIMVETIKKLILQKYQAELSRKDAEFRFLQAQINPHFIYNTLQVISGMGIVKGVPEINEISVKLAKIIRYSVNTKQNILPLREELENLVCYLEIQRIRFKEFLQYEINIEDDIDDLCILKLLIQPLVENSIMHGIEKKLPGSIQVKILTKDADVYIEVLDNGAGITGEKLELLKVSIRKLADEPKTVGSGSIGLWNVNNRIKNTYGEQYGLSIESSEGEWTRVSIVIPATKCTEEGVPQC